MSSRSHVLAAAGLALAVVLGLGGSGCSRPSATECELALSNWFTLIYWEKAEQEIAAAPPAEREALRKAKSEDRDKKFAAGIALGVQQCRGARDFDGVKCMKAATTAAAARKCRAPKDD